MGLNVSATPDLNWVALWGLGGAKPLGIFRVDIGLRSADEGSAGASTIVRSFRPYLELDATQKRLIVRVDGTPGINGWAKDVTVYASGPLGEFSVITGVFDPPERVYPYTRIIVTIYVR